MHWKTNMEHGDTIFSLFHLRSERILTFTNIYYCELSWDLTQTDTNEHFFINFVKQYFYFVRNLLFRKNCFIYAIAYRN